MRNIIEIWLFELTPELRKTIITRNQMMNYCIVYLDNSLYYEQRKKIQKFRFR